MPLDFEAQCVARLAAKPRVVSPTMGLFPRDYVKSLKEKSIAWFATATTRSEALRAEEAGADAIIGKDLRPAAIAAPSIPLRPKRSAWGLFALIPQLADSLSIPGNWRRTRRCGGPDAW